MSNKEWDSYRRGIHVMKERSYANMYDPTGFLYQAYIHSWPPYDGSERSNQIVHQYGWHTCQHSHYWFYPWHRMYLYFYERILRKAANDPNLTIPYWDYSGPGQNRSIPEAFRLPADESRNPLYLKSGRCDAINRGKPLRPEVTDPYGGLRSRFYAIDKHRNELNVCHSFGGERLAEPAFLGNGSGMVYMLPHAMVHRYVGGPNGVMSNVCLSPKDPIFMIHHIQIDRIWESWVRLGGLLPIDSQFLDQTFDFFDEYGRRVSPRVRDFIHLPNLQYKYEEYIEAQRVVPIFREPELCIDFDARNTKYDLALNYNKRSVIIRLKQTTVQLLEDLAKDAYYLSRVRFTLQFDVDYIEPSNFFDVYLNLSPQSLPFNQDPYYVGSMIVFDVQCTPLERKTGSMRGRVTDCFDITTKLRQIVKNDYNLNGFVSNQLNLTFIARDCADNYFMNSSENMISFNYIVLVHISDF